MEREDWYRRTTWSQDVKDAFHERLGGSGGSYQKAQCARIQASYLENTGDPHLVEAALELLDLVLAEWPEPSELASRYSQKASCFKRLGNIDSAVTNFRRAIEAEVKSPNFGATARIEFMWFIAINKLVSLYPEALSLQAPSSDGPQFPIDDFRAYGAKALMFEAQGERANAARSAQHALEAASHKESGFRYHTDLGLVGAEHAEVIGQLRRLAADSHRD